RPKISTGHHIGLKPDTKDGDPQDPRQGPRSVLHSTHDAAASRTPRIRNTDRQPDGPAATRRRMGGGGSHRVLSPGVRTPATTRRTHRPVDVLGRPSYPDWNRYRRRRPEPNPSPAGLTSNNP